MKIKIIGKMNPLVRVVTGLYSFDKAFANKKGKIGFPIRGITEVAGTTGCGKTTFVLSLAGMIALAMKSNITFSDIEGYEPEMMISVLESVGFEGTVKLINQKTDEKALDEMITQTEEEDFSVAIFDSIGAVSPLSELRGEFGEANMGRRAALIAQVARRVVHLSATMPDKTFFLINHQYPKVGGKGVTTPGGEVMKFNAPIRIRMKRVEELPDGSYVLEGHIVKNRFGFEDRKFYAFIIVGQGIHLGMTSIIDCKKKGLLSGNWRSVKIGDVSYGSYSTILQKALDGDTEFFVPFQKLLEGLQDEPADISTEDQDIDDRTSDDGEEI